MVGTWIRLAHVELSSGASTIDSGTFTKTKNLQFVIFTVGGASCKQTVQFNGDSSGSAGSSGNYFYRTRTNNDSYSDSNNQVRLVIQGSSTTGNAYSETKVVNIDGQEKQTFMSSMECADGAGNSPDIYKGMGKWTTTSGQIESIKVLSDTGNNFGVGSYITVFGDSDDIVSDEKTTLADATVTTDSPSTTTTTTSGATQQGSQSGSNQTTAHVTIGSNTGLKFTSTHSGTGAAVGTFDLGSALASKWIAQVSFTTGSGYTSSGNGMFAFGISDKSTYSSSEHMNTNSSGDTVNWIWHLGASNDRTQRIRTILNGSGSDGSNGTSRAWEDSTTFYFEMSYDGSTVTVQRKTDNTYATNHSQSAVTKATSGITGLRYFNWGSTDDGGSQGGFNVTLNTLKIYDDTDSLTTTSSVAPEAGTRYEEVDTRKIYRRTAGNVTYEPSLTSSTNWLATNNSSSDKITLDTTAGEVDYIGTRDGNWNSLTYNLGSALSNTEWVVRARINITSLTAGNQAWFIMGMSKVPSSTEISVEGSGSTTDSCLGFIMYESSNKRFGLAGGNDRKAVVNYMGYDTLGFTPSTNTYYYVELKRTSDANATFTMYSDSTFSTVVQTKTNTGNLAGASDLQYLGFYNMKDVATGGAFVVEVDQITIHNATTSASTPVWKERGSA